MRGLLGGLATGVVLLAGPAAAEPARTIIVLDGSGSMWGRIDGRPKLEIARETVAQVVTGLPGDRALGLIAYGHRRKGDCSDIELIVPPAPHSGAAIVSAVQAMRFQGKTPLTEAVRAAATALRSDEEPATVVLVTDGLETCDGDPCALAAELEASGVDFTAHVIGFGLSRDEGAALACMAETTGGRYLPAGDAAGLQAALAATVAATPETAPLPEPPAEPPAHHFPGAAWMAQAALEPSGRSFGPAVPAPAPIDFPADGRAEACAAQCSADAACGAWRFEPPGSYFVEEARCVLYAPDTEFSVRLLPAEEGWVSGMKPGVTGLVRPWVPVGATDVPVTLTLTEPPRPEAEITVLWTGPANDGDRVELISAGTDDPALAGFDVNETIEPGDRPEGAGTLTLPAEPGPYELRYVLGREVDRREIFRQPLGTGMPAAVEETAAAMPLAAAATEPVTLVPPPAQAGTAIVWSLVPLDGQATEAVAMPEAVTGPFDTTLEPGRWQVEGESDSLPFRAVIEVRPGAPAQRFEIPVGLETEGMGEDAPTPGPAATAEASAMKVTNESAFTLTFRDGPTGLGFALPPGWGADAPFFYETAAGVPAKGPTMGFYPGADPAPGPALVLNPIRWTGGPCTVTAAGDLCALDTEEARTAAQLIAPRLSLTPGGDGQ